MSGGVEHGREPCPDRILDDVGGAFGMGAVGGGLWHTVKGIKNSPQGQRLLGGSEVCGSTRRTKKNETTHEVERKDVPT